VSDWDEKRRKKMKTSLDFWKENTWNPSREMAHLQTELDHWLGGLFGNHSKSRAKYSPLCDLEETENNYQMTFDIPGMKKEDIKVEVARGQLVISGERKEETKKDTKYRHIEERYAGKFMRSFTLPDDVSAEKIEADYRDGVLRVQIPKAAVEKPRQVAIGERKDSGRINVA
jgi:HSP20 family protein